MAAFAEATRILFKIIQTTHHLQNTAVTGGKTVPPASLQRKMREQATLVRPASPTEDTMMKLAGNALNWLHTCMQILEEHYQEILQQLTERLKRIHLTNWPEAFQDMEDHGHSTPGPAPEPVPKRVASPETDNFPQKPCTYTEENTAASGGKTIPPASLQRKMRELATLVRPASPTEDTMVKLAGNALNWLHTCMQILEEHYREILRQLTEKLKRIHLRNWPEAFQDMEDHGHRTPGPAPEPVPKRVASPETDNFPQKPCTNKEERRVQENRGTPWGLGN
ncbi:hypothetical protein SKAU_G00386730 [Synaphobranchus kaupii]|uniref:Uncharacterized protein n=2 Tax=Synaphobranchus kaupii TaxID=118154 RepID=A0A9Q1EAS7_SYNKA|nr:hypothetical protein SKAU_G00386730 [Synaphobranchus kaupii]